MQPVFLDATEASASRRRLARSRGAGKRAGGETGAVRIGDILGAI